MLTVKGLTLALTKDMRTVVEKLDFTLNEGDKTVLIGEEGNGKSTLLKLLYDPALIETYAEYTGEIYTGGAVLGYLPQEFPYSGAVADIFSRDAHFSNLNPRERADIAAQLGLPLSMFDDARESCTLSGGERVKLSLALILAKKPDILLLDEPSNDLDLITLRWLEEFISDLSRPMLFVSHDETLIENTATSVIHIEQLQKKSVPRVTVARMPYRDYMSARERDIDTQTRLSAKEREEFRKKQERLRRIYESVERDLRNVSRQDPHGGRMLKKKMKSVKAQEARYDKEREGLTQAPRLELPVIPKWGDNPPLSNGKTVLDLKLLELCAGDRRLCGEIELKLVGPKKICIIGENGAGKTTLIRHIADALLPRSDLKTVYMPQDYADGLSLEKTPVEFLCRVGDKDERSRIQTFLGSMRYTQDEMHRRARELSGGQKAKLLFLKIILDGANVLILDEPTRNFSPMSNPVIRALLRDFGGAIIAVSHDRRFIEEVCDEVYELSPDGLRRF